MKVNKTTRNFAIKRNLDITVDFCETRECDVLEIWEMGNDCEPAVAYRANLDGTYIFQGNIWLSQEVKEELPATIFNEKHLREVLAFLATEIA